MTKFIEDDVVDQEVVCAAGSKLALLADLFSGCGRGTYLDLGERAIDGLATILRECAGACDQADKAAAAMRVTREAACRPH